MRTRAGAAIFLCLFAAPLSAAPADSLASRYRESLKALAENRASEEKTRVDHDRAVAAAQNLREQLIANAAKIQEIETALAATEAALPELNKKLHELEGEFARDRAKVARLLAILQRLDADMPPALVVKPEDSLAAARGAMQLGSVLPPLHAEAAALSNRLKLLEQTRGDLTAKVTQQQGQVQALRQAHVETDRLLELRHQEQLKAAQKLAELHGIAEQFAKTAVNLKSLMDRIAALREGPGNPQARIVAANDKNRVRASFGTLRIPVIGRSAPGDPSGPASNNLQKPVGIWFESAKGAQAVAPADSEVVFAGPYQNFGQVLILEMNGGYHLTLAGLGRIDVRIGDQVLAGEPVGTLSEGMPARLYLELRRNGQTVDPAPWLGAELRKAKGT